MITYEKKTKQFGQEELELIQNYGLEEIICSLKASDALVSLRIIAEVFLNEDLEKYEGILDRLIIDESLLQKIRDYQNDLSLTLADLLYMSKIEADLKKKQKSLIDLIIDVGESPKNEE
jgi:hypothetical protein